MNALHRRYCWFFILLLPFFAACSDSNQVESPDTPSVQLRPLTEQLGTRLGELRGVARQDGAIMHYQGIPYALPPVGDRRWRRPTPAASWKGVLDATAPGPACVQGTVDDPSVQSEDCLYLNIAAPALEPPEPLPVMVWFHGGGDDGGSGHQVLFDLPGLAHATGHIVVSVNARLGFLGFLALPALRAEDPSGSTGNYHHLDQVLALEWVRDNIAEFNGNASRVTLFGESAGANAVCRHLSSPQSEGLFRRAILQSSACAAPLVKPLQVRYEQGARFTAAWDCEDAADPLACLRGQDAFDLRQKLVAAGKSADTLTGGRLPGQGAFRPVAALDEVVFVERPPVALAGIDVSTEIILGVARNEGTLFLTPAANSLPEDTLLSYQSVVTDAFSGLLEGDVERLTSEFYPCEGYASCSDAFADLVGDVLFVCPSLAAADALVTQGNRVYFYEFVQPVNETILLLRAAPEVHPNAPALGVPHTADLYYLWDFAILQNEVNPGTTTEYVQSYWASFAASGEPISTAGIDWPVYTPNARTYLRIGETLSVGSGYKTTNCAFINQRSLEFSPR